MYHGRAAASVASLLLVLSFGRLALAADLPQVAVKQLDGKVEITIGGRRFATYF